MFDPDNVLSWPLLNNAGEMQELRDRVQRLEQTVSNLVGQLQHMELKAEEEEEEPEEEEEVIEEFGRHVEIRSNHQLEVELRGRQPFRVHVCADSVKSTRSHSSKKLDRRVRFNCALRGHADVRVLTFSDFSSAGSITLYLCYYPANEWTFTLTPGEHRNVVLEERPRNLNGSLMKKVVLTVGGRTGKRGKVLYNQYCKVCIFIASNRTTERVCPPEPGINLDTCNSIHQYCCCCL